ncbi:MAG: alpha-ribazole phosphatase [Anaerobutyricum sp.]|nr:alpha-ribazole phosphatase [Anaerobutyricum sp.]
MRIYLVRHGETMLNRTGCYYGKTDAVLSETGIAQAKSLGKLFGGTEFDYVVSSPLVRAYNTAEIITRGRTQEIFCDSRLVEQDFGIFEGLTYEQIKEQYPKELTAWNKEYETYRIPGGESFSMVRGRVEEFLSDLPRENKTMLLVAHKGTLGHLLSAMLSLPLNGYWNFVFEQGCYSMIDLEDGYAIIRKLNAKIL